MDSRLNDYTDENFFNNRPLKQTPQHAAATERFKRFLIKILTGEETKVKRWRGKIVIHSSKPWKIPDRAYKLNECIPKVNTSVDRILESYDISFTINPERNCIKIEVDQAACPQPMRRKKNAGSFAIGRNDQATKIKNSRSGRDHRSSKG